MDAYRCYELDVRRYHLDSSRWSVHGAYEETSEGQGCLEIRHGYSKAHRPDLKQFVVDMICCNDGDVPLAFEVGSGNQSDKAVFGDRLKAFAQQWDVDGMLVADSALYSENNITTLDSLRWITRVPLTLTAAQDLVTQLPSEAFEDSEREGYRLSQVCSTYGGVQQRWVVIENTQRVESDDRQLEKRIEKQRKQAQKDFRAQGKTDFRCAQDAYNQAQTLAAQWRYHTLSELKVIEHPHYGQSGRPKKGATPTHLTYRVTGTLVADEAAIEQAKRKSGRFILATNVIDEEITAEDILSDYKGQQSPERGFGILKDPLFFTSSVFLKTPERIAALAIIMGLSLMVYTLAQRKLRYVLAAVDETVPDQRKRPTQTPILRWIFQCFQAIHLVWLNGQAQISNLTPERLKILRFLGAPCQKYYLIC